MECSGKALTAVLVVVAGFVIVIGAAAWSHYGHHGGGHHDAMHGSASSGEGAAGPHHGRGRDDAMPHNGHDGHEDGPEHEMGAHHEGHDHHGAAARVETEGLAPGGTLQDGVRVVEMKARQFAFEPSVVAVRADETVRLEVTSQDVPHGIDLEGYGIDKRLPPQETVTIEFTAEEAGQSPFHCSVYCGRDHDEMVGTLVVLPREQ
jgi:cytochrome c oxidase subunit 2